MNYFLLYSIIINLFCTINAMNIPLQAPSLWAITTDNNLVEIDETIAQQSNLLTILQEKYAGTKDSPIPIPVNQKSFDFFCFHLTTSAQELLKQLTDENYSLLMNITEKLKCSIFYTELIEQLLQEKRLSNGLALEQLKMAKLKKAIYKQFLTKRRVKKNKHTLQESVSFEYSLDGNYFLETVANYVGQAQINVWDAKKLTCIKTFSSYKTAQFSKNSDYVILHNERENHGAMAPLLYSIANNNTITLLDDCQNYRSYRPTMSPNGHYIVQTVDNIQFIRRHILLSYIKHENRIQEISLGDDWDHTQAFVFCPDKKHILYLANDSLMKCELNNPHNKQKIAKITNGIVYHTLTINNSSLIALGGHQTKEFFTIEDNIITPIKSVHSGVYQNTLSLFIPQKKIICYNSDKSTLCLMNQQGEQIASYISKNHTDWIDGIAADKTGSYLVSRHSRKDDSHYLIRSTIIFWNLSNINSYIPGIKRDTRICIQGAEFTQDGLFITQGTKTELWDMDGDKVLSLGKSSCFSQDCSTNSILTAHNSHHLMQRSCDGAWRSMPPITTIYRSQVNTQKAKVILEEIKRSLTPPQAELFNAHYLHKKEKDCIKKLYPNMPDGRALASFNKEHTFITKQFKLGKHNFTPKTQLISQQEKLLAEPQQFCPLCSQ